MCNFRVYGLHRTVFYPLRTRKTLNNFNALIPDCGDWQSLQVAVLIEFGYLSAKDAKDAKFYYSVLLNVFRGEH